MSYRFYVNSEKAWKHIFRALEKATTSIFIEMYIFLPDTVDYDFVALLTSKAKEGVHVVLVLDGFGSRAFPKAQTETLLQAGVELHWASHYCHRLHRKIVIVDTAIAFTGGVNIHESAKHWADLAISTTNKRLVQKLINVFVQDYRWAGGTSKHILELKNTSPLGRARAKIIEHFPALRVHRLRALYHQYFKQAEHQIVITTPYFVPKRYLLAEIHQAHLRGVRVTILLPTKTDHRSIDSLNRYFLHKAHRLGANIYLSTEMNHAKTITIDTNLALVGSHNLDVLSFRLNAEAGIELNHPDTVSRLQHIVSGWLGSAKIYAPDRDPLTWKEKLGGRLTELVLHLI